LLLQLAPPHLLPGPCVLSGPSCGLSGARLPGPLQSMHDGPGNVRGAYAGRTVYTAAAMVIGQTGPPAGNCWQNNRGTL